MLDINCEIGSYTVSKLETMINVKTLKNLGYAHCDFIPLCDFDPSGYPSYDTAEYVEKCLGDAISDMEYLTNIIGEELENFEGSIIQKMDFTVIRNEDEEINGYYFKLENPTVEFCFENGIFTGEVREIIEKKVIAIEQYDGDAQCRFDDENKIIHMLIGIDLGLGVEVLNQMVDMISYIHEKKDDYIADNIMKERGEI